MDRLSAPIEQIKKHYEIAVIGSGYGGAIAASRLARAGREVVVFERGRELLPGEYPDDPVDMVGEVQVDCPEKHFGSRTALFDFRLNEDMNVIVGCGLGGTSLINANVSLRPESRIFDDSHWPVAVREDAKNAMMDRFFGYAEEMLGATPYPDQYPRVPKLLALEKAAKFMKESFYRPLINVTFREGVNNVGVLQHACVSCGDCVTGCNYSAKNTVLMNYLPDAKNHGAEIFTEMSLHYLERQEDQWRLHFVSTNSEIGICDRYTITADLVIVAAGTLGSTEILLRSREKGLCLSEALGRRFSGNGDMIGFTYNADEVINGVGFGSRKPQGREPVGPCVTGIIDARNKPDLDEGKVIEEASLPGAFALFLPKLLAAAAKLTGKESDLGVWDRMKKTAREIYSLLRGAHVGAMRNTQTYLVVAHDSSAGEMFLSDDRLRVSWPGAGKSALLSQSSERMSNASEALSGTYVKNPIWNQWTNQELISGHPLGGCIMAEDAKDGVVNHKGQVYSNTAGISVHDGLYVMDASIIPRSLGVNPLLTISALAERSCHHLALDHGWAIEYERNPSRAGQNSN